MPREVKFIDNGEKDSKGRAIVNMIMSMRDDGKYESPVVIDLMTLCDISNDDFFDYSKLDDEARMVIRLIIRDYLSEFIGLPTK